MFDVKGFSCALFFGYTGANCQHGGSADDPLWKYPFLCVWVKQSRFESQRIQVSPERFFPKCFSPQPMDARRLEPKSKALVAFIHTQWV